MIHFQIKWPGEAKRRCERERTLFNFFSFKIRIFFLLSTSGLGLNLSNAFLKSSRTPKMKSPDISMRLRRRIEMLAHFFYIRSWLENVVDLLRVPIVVFCFEFLSCKLVKVATSCHPLEIVAAQKCTQKCFQVTILGNIFGPDVLIFGTFRT